MQTVSMSFYHFHPLPKPRAAVASIVTPRHTYSDTFSAIQLISILYIPIYTLYI